MAIGGRAEASDVGISSRSQTATYVASNAELKATTKGVALRRTKQHDDKESDGVEADIIVWGSVVSGVEEDGWLSVDDHYLPMAIDGCQVLKRIKALHDRGHVRRIALLGEKDSLLRALSELGHRKRTHSLDIIVISPRLASPEVQSACKAFGFRLFLGDDDGKLYQELQRFKPELLVSILWPRRVKDDVLALCRDCINFHPSLLPRHRGSLTQFWAVFDDDKEAGVTCHRMVHDFDAGHILHQVSIPLAPGETALSLNRKLAGASERCFQHVIDIFLNDPGGLPQGEAWDVSQFPYHFRRIPNKGTIDPKWPEDKVDRFIRAMYFPPHGSAKAVGPDGQHHLVDSIEEFRGICIGLGQAPACPNQEAGTKLWPYSFLAAVVVPFVAIICYFMRGMNSGEQHQQQQAPDAHVAQRYTLLDHPRARCLDGSPLTYYYAPSTSTASRDKWILYMQGGGWCAEDPKLVGLAHYSHEETVAHPDMCSDRAKGYHGSSRGDRPSRSLAGRGFISADPTENPMMHDWNKVIIRNCDGTLFLGSADMQLNGLFFRGRDNFLATIEQLVKEHGMGQATDVVLSGCSAGGVASVIHADTLANYLDDLPLAPGRARFLTVLSDSGVFPEWPKSGAPDGVFSFPQLEWIFSSTNASTSAPKTCLEKGLGWRCLQVGVALPHVRTPVFLLQSVADSWHISDVRQQGALDALAARLRQEIANAVQGRHAGAIDSCFHHCGEWGRIRWGGRSNAEVFQAWYEEQRRLWAKSPATYLSSNRSLGAVSDGWPLMHTSNPWAEGCSSAQSEHLEWHGRISRISK